MGRLQYVNRKSEGVKLGTVVAKDILKRIPPASGHKAALRDPFVELDVSGKLLTDEGCAEVLEALLKAISHGEGEGRILRLEELSLKGNKLTANSLRRLAKVVALSSFDLKDLDISANEIQITTREDVESWQTFLESFERCCVLRRLDVGHQPLGPKAYEILAKVYTRQEFVDLSDELEGGGGPDADPDMAYARKSMEALIRSTRAISVFSEASATSENEVVTPRTRKSESFSTPGRKSSCRVTSDMLQVYTTSTGLRSVPYLIFERTSISDTCALYLSYVVAYHGTPEELQARVPPVKPGPAAQQLAEYEEIKECTGIVYAPHNGKITSAGLNVLRIAENDRAGNSTSGRTSKFSTNDLDRARSRIQGDTLRDLGPASNDLWVASLKILQLTRILVTPQKSTKDHPISREMRETGADRVVDNGHLESYAARATPQKGSKTPLAPANPNTPVVLQHPKRRKQSTIAKLSMTSLNSKGAADLDLPLVSPKRIANSGSYSNGTWEAKGLNAETWARIITHAVEGANEVLSETQRASIVRWGRDRETLAREMAELGKMESTQIWNVLHGMGCLAYEPRSS